MKKIYKITLVLALVLTVTYLAFKVYSENLVKEAQALPLANPQLTELVDGSQQGACQLGPVQVTVETQVEDGQLTNINIVEHFNGLGGQAESIPQAILDQQSLEVETVSGATVSSLCIIQAVDNSLKP